jgi:hypothetical protein
VVDNIFIDSSRKHRICIEPVVDGVYDAKLLGLKITESILNYNSYTNKTGLIHNETA